MRTDATETKDIFKNPMWLNPMSIFYICSESNFYKYLKKNLLSSATCG